MTSTFLHTKNKNVIAASARGVRGAGDSLMAAVGAAMRTRSLADRCMR
jgi:hypothetical protein